MDVGHRGGGNEAHGYPIVFVAWRAEPTRRGQDLNRSPAPTVLFVDQSGEIGGAELSLLDIVRHYGGPLTVCLMSPGPFAEKLSEDDLPVVLMDAEGIRGVRREHGLGSMLRAVPSLWRFVRRFAAEARKHDIVYANTMKAFVVSGLSYPLHRRPIVWHLHDMLTPEHFSASLRIGCVTLSRLTARCVIVNSHATARAFRQSGGKGRVEVVYNGVDPAPFDALDAARARERLISETGLATDRPVIGAFSRIARWKGQHVLIEAIRLLPGVQAVIVGAPLFGEGAYEAQLMHSIAAAGLQDRVRMLGFRADIPALMKGVDVVAHTSTSAEPFGRVIVEGMLARKPVVATRGGGAAELVQDHETGILVEPGDPSVLASAIETLLEDGAFSERMVQKAEEEARRKFHVTGYTAAVARILETLLRGRTSES